MARGLQEQVLKKGEASFVRIGAVAKSLKDALQRLNGNYPIEFGQLRKLLLPLGTEAIWRIVGLREMIGEVSAKCPAV